jgi:hypothetical protein
MTTLNDLFKELNDVKKENKKAHKEKVEKYNLIESPNELDIQNEIKDIFSQLSSLKEQTIEHQIKQQEKKQKEEKILTGLEKILQEKTKEVEKVIEIENEEEVLVEQIKEDKEEIQEPQEEIKEEIQTVEEYTKYITQEEDKREKKIIKEANDFDALTKEIDQLKKRISSLSTQIATAPTRFPEGNSGGELNLNKPVNVTATDYHIGGAGGFDLFLCNTENHDISIYLPEASKNHGFKVHIKKMHRNHQLYIRGYNSSELIDEKDLVTINTIYVSLQMICNGSHWYIV